MILWEKSRHWLGITCSTQPTTQQQRLIINITAAIWKPWNKFWGSEKVTQLNHNKENIHNLLFNPYLGVSVISRMSCLNRTRLKFTIASVCVGIPPWWARDTHAAWPSSQGALGSCCLSYASLGRVPIAFQRCWCVFCQSIFYTGVSATFSETIPLPNVYSRSVYNRS